MKKFLLTMLLLLISAAPIMSGRPESSSWGSSKSGKKDKGMGGYWGPGSGFGNIPGFGNGWPGNGGVVGGGGYGAGFGGPTGGYSKDGTIRSTVECKEKGPCYKKKLSCPAKCFTSYSRSGKGYGGGGGGGGCTIDCKKKCAAYC